MDYRKKYFARARRAAKLLSWCPFVRMVGLNGSIVRGEDTQESDIDFLIIAKTGRLYCTRFFATALVALGGYRRHGQKVAGRICLNCFLNADDPDITPKNPRSLLKVAKAYKYLIPLVEEGAVAKSFFKKNSWFEKYPVAGGQYSTKLQKNEFKKYPLKPKYFGEKILSGRLADVLEQKLMKFQQKKILAGFKEGDETVATKDEIRLHPHKG